MKKAMIGLVMLSLVAVSGCGDDSRDTLGAREETVEETLYLAYAANTPGTAMYGLLVGDFKAVSDQINAFIADKYELGGVTAGTTYDWPLNASGVNGSLTYTTTADPNVGSYVANVGLTNFSTQQLSGNISVDGSIRLNQTVVDPSTYTAYYNPVTTITATTDITSDTASGRGYAEIIYAVGWCVELESVSDGGVPQKYSVAGVLELDDLIRYNFSYLSYDLNSPDLSVAGAFVIHEDGYDDRCFINGIISSTWGAGTINVTARSMSCSVILDGTEAGFSDSSSHYWTKEDWRTDELAPRSTEDDD